MLKRWMGIACIAAALVALLSFSAAQASGQDVLFVSAQSDATQILEDLVTACGMRPVTVEKAEYTPDMAQLYDYFVLEDPDPLEDILRLDKAALCVGEAFLAMQWVETGSIKRVTIGEMTLEGNRQSVILKPGTLVITDASGGWETFGSIETADGLYPLGVMRGNIFYAPDISADTLSVFAAAQMMNRYFGREDGGEVFVTINSVTPLHDLTMLQLIANKMYACGIPFIVTIRPIYYNTDYPSFIRYCNALLYMQSKGGSIVMQDAIVTGNELVGDTLDDRLKKAYENLAGYGIYPADKEGFPFAISLDWLMSVTPDGTASVCLPVNTTVVYDVFETEQELDNAIKNINCMRLEIGDYNPDASYAAYNPLPVNDDYVYRDTAQQKFAGLMSQGNRVLRILVVLSGLVIIVLLIWGWRLYRKKFIVDPPKPDGKEPEHD